ncbi:NHL repeat-containing protein, partial [Acrasis kona]
MNSAWGITIDQQRNLLFFSELSANYIRMINLTSGNISRVSGTGASSTTGDGNLAILASVNKPTGIASDSINNMLYIAESSSHVIRAINRTSGLIKTIAGISGTYGYNMDGIATQSTLNNPRHIKLAYNNTILFIADSGNSRVRSLNLTSGIISTIVGNGIYAYRGYNGDNILGTSAMISAPSALDMDVARNLLYISDTDCRVRVLNLTSGLIWTFSGTGSVQNFCVYNGEGNTPTTQGIGYVMGLAVDTNADVIFQSSNNQNRVSMIPYYVPTLAPSRVLSMVGSKIGYLGDGSLDPIYFNFPMDSQYDSTNKLLYIADYYNNRIRVYNTTSGLVSLLAGDGRSSLNGGDAIINGDGFKATDASINTPTSIAIDSFNNQILVADSLSGRIKAISRSTGVITTIAGGLMGQNGFSGDYMPANTIYLKKPNGIAYDPNNNIVYFSDADDHKIRQVNLFTGMIQTIIGTGTAGFNGDLYPATTAQLNSPSRLAFDDIRGLLYICDYTNSRIRMFNTITGVISTIVGNGTSTWESGDGDYAINAMTKMPRGVTVDKYNNIVYFSTNLNTVRSINMNTGIINTIAGITNVGDFYYDNAPSYLSTLNAPSGLSYDYASSALYLSDGYNYRIRMITIPPTVFSCFGVASNDPTVCSSNGTCIAQDTCSCIGAYAGSSCQNTTDIAALSYGTNGSTIYTLPNAPTDCTYDSFKNVFYYTDSSNHRVVSMNLISGVINVVAGNGTAGSSGDNSSAVLASLNKPSYLSFDPFYGYLFISDTENNKIRAVNRLTGMIYTIAGNGTNCTSSVIDKIPAASSCLNKPSGLAYDKKNNTLFVADSGNNRIRLVSLSSGIITTVVGTGVMGTGSDNVLGTNALLNKPNAVAYDETRGILYISDAGNNRIRTLNIINGLVSTIAWLSLNNTRGMTLDKINNILYLSDYSNNVVRSINLNTRTVNVLSNLYNPIGMCFNENNSTLYFADNANQRIIATSVIQPPVTCFGIAFNAPNVCSSSGSCVSQDKCICYGSNAGNMCQTAVPDSSYITTFAGTGVSGNGTEGSIATMFSFNSPSYIVVDVVKNLVYVSDTGNHVIRVINVTSRNTTTFAGTNTVSGSTGDGNLAINAKLNMPQGLAIDYVNNLVYIAESNCVRVVNRNTGIITRFAGVCANRGTNGDGGSATSANLNLPYDVAVDSINNLVYIAEYGGNV